jgi:chromosome segregation ATPase
MFDGLSYLITQIVVLLLIAMVVGFALGRILRPRRSDAAIPVLATENEPQGPSTTELQLLLSQAQSQISQLREQITVSEAESLRLRTKIRVLSDEKETEMGRLESGAIVALESAISQNQALVTELEERLRTSEQALQEAEGLLDAERRRTAQLQHALAERDQLLATLTTDRAAQPGSVAPGHAVPPPS